jgi:two-component system chemotaxis response regulator CheY
VTEAENGQEALGRCQLSMPDLVLLDWDMPVMTGIEFIASFRAIRGNEKAKAVFCTSKSGAHDIHRGIAAGANEYVTKPFDEATLRAKLQAIGAI